MPSQGKEKEYNKSINTKNLKRMYTHKNKKVNIKKEMSYKQVNNKQWNKRSVTNKYNRHDKQVSKIQENN